MRGTTPADASVLTAHEWRYVEGTCTEGILDMSVRGFSERLAVHDAPGGLLLVSDRRFEVDGCEQTVRLAAQRSTDVSVGAGWSFQETARVSHPDSPRCERVQQEDTLGEVRMRGAHLELFIRRAPWCGGYEARLVYQRSSAAGGQRPDAGSHSESDSQAAAHRTLRHFIAAFHDRDSLAVAALYAPSGFHEDPQRPDQAGQPTRHEGRVAVAAYFASVFHQVPWLALRLRAATVTGAQAGDEEGEGARPSAAAARRVHATVEYMDPRLMSPMTGELLLDLIDGRVFASRLLLVGDGSEESLDTASP
jgi:hypothetical protein